MVKIQVAKVRRKVTALLLRSLFFALAAANLVLVLYVALQFAMGSFEHPIILTCGLVMIVILGALIVAGLGHLAELFGQHARDLEAQQTFESMMRGEPTRRFSLYLRPFNSTNEISETIQQAMPVMGHIGLMPGERIELEAQLERATRCFAPLFCLGKPLEHIGAGRIATSDAIWKSAIASLMHRAEVIVLLPSSRPGTLHEIETILTRDLVHKTLFVDAPRSDESDRYRDEDEWPVINRTFERLGYVLPKQSDHGQIFFYGNQNQPVLLYDLDIDDEDRVGRFCHRVSKWMKTAFLTKETPA